MTCYWLTAKDLRLALWKQCENLLFAWLQSATRMFRQTFCDDLQLNVKMCYFLVGVASQKFVLQRTTVTDSEKHSRTVRPAEFSLMMLADDDEIQ